MRETISHSRAKFPFDNISTSDTACLTSLSPVAVVKAGEPFNATGQTDKMASLKIRVLDKTFKQATGTMIPLVYVGSIVI